MTSPQLYTDRFCTLNAFAKAGIVITPNCRMKPSITAPTKYIFENKPTRNTDLDKLRIDKEKNSCVPARHRVPQVLLPAIL